MSKRSAKKKAGHNGFVRVFQKIAPFLFVKKVGRAHASTKEDSAIKTTSSKKIATKRSAPQSKKRAAGKSAHKKKTSPKKSVAHTAKKPATTLEAIKKTDTKKTSSSTDISLHSKQVESELESEELMQNPQEVELQNESIESDTAEGGALDELMSPSPAATGDLQPVSSEAEESVSVKKRGSFILKDEEKEVDAKAVKAQLLDEEDSFLKKANVQKEDLTKGQSKTGGWNAFKARFFTKDSTPTKEVSSQPEMTEEEIEKDSFLRKVQRKNKNAVVGTSFNESEEEEQMIEEVMDKADQKRKAEKEAMEEMIDRPVIKNAADGKKPKILSASDLRKETREAKEAAKRAEKEIEEIKKEMRKEQKERRFSGKDDEEIEEKKKPKEEVPTPSPAFKKKQHKQKNGFQKLLASVAYIGLGKERNSFIQNLGTMLNAGLPLIDAIKTLQMETRLKPMRKLLGKVVMEVENGIPLWRAMENQSFFTLHAIALIRIGEEAGNLAQNVVYLAEQEEKDAALKGKVKMAMIYPTIISVLVFLIVVGLGMFVLPNLIGVLYSLNVPLPFVTRMVIGFTNLFTEYGAVGVPSFLAGLVVLAILIKFTPLKVVAQWIMFRIPGVGRLAREATIARFGVILGGLLRAGVPVVDAMDSLVEVTPIVSYRNLYAKMRDRIVIGETFSKSFSSIKGSRKLLPVSVQQLIVTGEKSGSLAEIVLKVSDIYDKKASSTAEKLPLILEPMLMIFMGGLVGTIAFAILIPIYSIVGTVGR